MRVGRQGDRSGRDQTENRLLDLVGQAVSPAERVKGISLHSHCAGHAILKFPMPEGSYLYCDVSLPVPLDQPFT